MSHPALRGTAATQEALKCLCRTWHQRVEIAAGRGTELLARGLVVDTALA